MKIADHIRATIVAEYRARPTTMTQEQFCAELTERLGTPVSTRTLRTWLRQEKDRHTPVPDNLTPAFAEMLDRLVAAVGRIEALLEQGGHRQPPAAAAPTSTTHHRSLAAARPEAPCLQQPLIAEPAATGRPPEKEPSPTGFWD